VNNDGQVTAGDALVIINAINAQVPSVGPLLPSAVDTTFVDADGDGFLSASDVLEVINFINSARHSYDQSANPAAVDAALSVVASGEPEANVDANELLPLPPMSLQPGNVAGTPQTYSTSRTTAPSD